MFGFEAIGGVPVTGEGVCTGKLETRSFNKPATIPWSRALTSELMGTEVGRLPHMLAMMPLCTALATSSVGSEVGRPLTILVIMPLFTALTMSSTGNEVGRP
jgi:hypothetical protein